MGLCIGSYGVEKEGLGSTALTCSRVGRGGTSEFTWQSGSLASRLVVSTVAVRRQQAADNLQETDKLDMYTKRRQSIVLVTKAVAWEI